MTERIKPRRRADGIDAAFRLSEGNTEALSLKGYALTGLNRWRADAEQVMRALLETAETRATYNVALLCAWLGDSARI